MKFSPLYWSAAFACLTAVLAGVGHGQSARDSSTPLDKPGWQKGDRWKVETRVPTLHTNLEDPGRTILWEFQVRGTETVGGHSCVRLEVDCLTPSASAPKLRLWCDRQTFFVRQFEVSVLTGGKRRVLQENYHAESGFSPVIAPLSALPLAMPAFLPAGSKGLNVFRHTSQPGVAGSKDLETLGFSHAIEQEVKVPTEEVRRELRSTSPPSSLLAQLESQQPAWEVQLRSGMVSTNFVWLKGQPWPVYSRIGKTEAWLLP